MSQYNKIKNTYLPTPSGSIDIGSDGARFGNLFLANNLALGNSVVTAADVGVPKITSLTYLGNDTAADPAGGQTITITGSGFKTSPAVYLGGTIVASVSYVSATSVTFVAPAKTAGSYTLSLVNTDGGTALFAAGMQYSGVPTWSTSAGSLANVYEYGSVSTTVAATGDAPITYTVSSGSLPSGLSIGSSNGVISGTTTAIASGSTTTNFSLNASDAQNQDTSRNFSITVNADSVSWSSPANNASYSLTPNTPMSTVSLSASSAAGKSITYTANSLPTGLSISGSTITGTPTGTGSSSSLITATAATTGKTATVTLNWSILSNYITATGGNITTSGNYRIHTFTGTTTFDVTSLGSSNGSVTYLVVAGGGGGGIRHAGGGGAGGVLSGTTTVSAQSYSITVGGGGSKGGENQPHATNGTNSIFSSLTSYGGGGGGQFQDNFNVGMNSGDAGYTPGQKSTKGYNGGSGGGGGSASSDNGPGGSGTPGQGNGGGPGSGSGDWGGGGGGGAGGGGQGGSGGTGGNGGTAISSDITGSTVYYAGGGGAGGGSGVGLGGGTSTTSQKGGGGDGAYRNAQDGGGNTGGGGGGQREGAAGGPGAGNGGSGVVIIRYQYQ